MERKKSYFKKTRLDRRFDDFNTVIEQLRGIANDLKNEPTLRAQAIAFLDELNECPFKLMAELRSLLIAINTKSMDEGEKE